MRIVLALFILFAVVFVQAVGGDYQKIVNQLKKIESDGPKAFMERRVAHEKFRGFAETQKVTLPEEEEEVITTYTKNQSQFNHYLKYEPPEDLKHLTTKDSDELDGILRKLKNSTEVTYRGSGVPKGVYGQKIVPGDVVNNNAFMSSSYSPGYSKRFAEAGASNTNESVLFRVQGKTGKNVSLYSHFQDEKGEAEAIFRPKTNFDVLAVRKSNKITYVLLKEKLNYTGPAKNIYTGKNVEVESACE